MDMMSLAISLLAVLAVATISNAVRHGVNLDDPQVCASPKIATLNFGDTANVTTAGNIPLSDTDCVLKYRATDSNGQCNEQLVTCVSVDMVKSMCYVSAEFSSDSKIMKLNCMTGTPPQMWCVSGKEDLELRLIQDPIKQHSNYGFVATLSVQCTTYTISPNTGSQSAPEPGEDKIHFPDIQDAINSTRVIGIVVGVCLACMFLIALLITYFYYKNKAYTGVPNV